MPGSIKHSRRRGTIMNILKEYHCKECGSTDMWYEVQTRYYWIPETSTYDEDEHHFGWYCNNCYMQGVEVYSALKD